MSVSMEGRVAYISGGSCMMARGTATAFLEAGGKVVLGDMKQELLDAAKADLVSKGFAAENIATAIVNVTDWDSIRSSFDQAEAAFGTVDVLVNIAGIIVAYYRLDDMKEEDWDLTFDVNVKGLMQMCREFVKRLKAKGLPGNIVNVSSNGAKVTYDDQVHYCASKAAVSNMTQCMASNFAPLGINVNAVCPGNFYEGPLWSNPENGLFLQYLHAGKVPGAKTVEDVRKYYMDQVPMRKGTGPEDVTKAVLYLIEQTCETGQAVPVTGGQGMLS